MFPPILEHVSESVKTFHNDIRMTFSFSHSLQISPPNSPLFRNKFTFFPYFRKMHLYISLLCSFNLRFLASFTFFLAFHLFWPWCIYASCVTRTGRLR